VDVLSVLLTVVRRWYITLPLLVASAAVTLAVYDNIAPDYQATATVVLLTQACSAQNGPGSNPTVTCTNPYYGGAATGRPVAAAIEPVILSGSNLATYANQGLSTNVTMNVSDAGFIDLSATGKKPAVVGATIQAMLGDVDRVSADLQRSSGADPSQWVRPQTLAVDAVPKQLSGNRQRAAIAIGVVGGLASLFAAVVVDGILRRRQARALALADAELLAAEPLRPIERLPRLTGPSNRMDDRPPIRAVRGDRYDNERIGSGRSSRDRTERIVRVDRATDAEPRRPAGRDRPVPGAERVTRTDWPDAAERDLDRRERPERRGVPRERVDDTQIITIDGRSAFSEGTGNRDDTVENPAVALGPVGSTGPVREAPSAPPERNFTRVERSNGARPGTRPDGDAARPTDAGNTTGAPPTSDGDHAEAANEAESNDGTDDKTNDNVRRVSDRPQSPNSRLNRKRRSQGIRS
jgi:hypothetical protein